MFYNTGMKKLKYSNFELLKNVFEEIAINYDESKTQAKQELFDSWQEIIGEKISKFSKLYEISDDNVLTIACTDSFIANELFMEKQKIFTLIVEKAEKLGINIKDIRFNYKIWKESSL